MSASAENFKAAKTWQLKHQLAYWKARAVALEYENGVLHDVIRQNNIGGLSTGNRVNIIANNTEFEDSSPVNNKRYDQSEYIPGSPNENDSDYNENESESDDNYNDESLEVSQEFIQFLFANAKYKEDAKRECERLKAEKAKEDETDNIVQR